MSIPEKALASASQALSEHLPENFGGCAWRCGDDGDDADEHLALVALTAAAPYMLPVSGGLTNADLKELLKDHNAGYDEYRGESYCLCGTQWPGDSFTEHLANVITAAAKE